MTSEPRSLQAAFADAEAKRAYLENSYSTSTPAFQDNLSAAIATYDECLRIADRVALFSPNETLEDITSGDLQYLLLNFHLAELTLKLVGVDRKLNLDKARGLYERFLRILDSYDLLSKSDARLLEQYLESRDAFSTASTSDAAARRATKISRFREEKELKRKLEVAARPRYCKGVDTNRLPSTGPTTKPRGSPRRRCCAPRPPPYAHHPTRPRVLPIPRIHRPRSKDLSSSTVSTLSRPSTARRHTATRHHRKRLFRAPGQPPDRPHEQDRAHPQQRRPPAPSLHTPRQSPDSTAGRLPAGPQSAHHVDRRVLRRGTEARRHHRGRR
jgi:TAP42-like family